MKLNMKDLFVRIVNPSIEHRAQMRTPRSRKHRSRFFHVVRSVAIMFVCVGVVLTGVRLWKNSHTTDGDDVNKNQTEIERQVLEQAGKTKLRDISGKVDVKVKQSTVNLKSRSTHSIESGSNCDIKIKDFGYVKPKYKKLLSKGQKASNVMCVEMLVKNVSKSDVKCGDMLPTVFLGADEVMKSNKVVYSGFSANGRTYVKQNGWHLIEEVAVKTFKKNDTMTVLYLFDVTGHVNDKYPKVLSVYINDGNGGKSLTHTFTIKE